MSLKEQKVIGEKIRIARAIANITQKELADLIGIGRVAILDMEKGRVDISISKLKKISEITNQPIEYFIKDIEPEFEEVKKGKNILKQNTM